MKKGNHKFLSHPLLSLRSLRAKVTISVVLPLVLILGTFMVVQYKTQQDNSMNNLALLASQTGLTIQNSLEIAMLNHNQEELQHILDSIGKNQILRIVYLLDTSGRVVFAPEGQGVGTQLDNHDPTCQPCHHLPPAQRPSSIVVSLAGGERVFRTMNPIVNLPQCQSCHDPSQHLNGVLLTDISMAPLEASLTNGILLNFLWWIAAILVTVIVANLVVERFVLRRLHGITNAIRDLGLGQQSSPLPENHDDEVSQVSLAFNEMARQVEKRNTENQHLSEDLQRQNTERGELLRRLITAQEDERARVARDLHDEFGQALAGLSLQTEAIKTLVPTNPEKALSVLDQTQDLIGKTSDQMYNLILALRPSVLDDLGLVAALRVHAERILTGAGIQFKLNSSGFSNRLPRDVETALYRIFQEAINNVVRHSHASKVSMSLSFADKTFRGEIADNGQGFDIEAVRSNLGKPQGLGLLGMQERIMQVHGQIEVSSNAGSGTKIVILIPLEEESVG
jgi:signal transduction histidine kinase